MNFIIENFDKLLGVAALIAVIINIFKYFGLVKDGQSGVWNTALSLIAAAVIFYVRQQFPAYAENLDTQAGQIAAVLTAVLTFLVQFGGALATHKLATAGKMSFIGKSLSN